MTTAARTQVIKKVGPYIENPDFTPKMIEKASVACKAICMRVSASNVTRISHTMPWMVSFLLKRPFGPISPETRSKSKMRPPTSS